MIHKLENTIKGNKILVNNTPSETRIIREGKKSLNFDTVIQLVKHYKDIINLAKNNKLFKINNSEINNGIKVILFDEDCTIETLFSIYNEVVQKYRTDLVTYTKLNYDKKNAVKFSPA